MTDKQSDNKNKIRDAWTRIETWLKEHTPQGRYKLKLGASYDQVQSAESAVGAQFPADLRESYLLHDGSEGTWVFVVGPFLSLDELITRWRSWHVGLENGYFEGSDFVSEPEKGIKPNWFNNKWLPVSDNQNGDYIYVDLDPADGGHLGQIIEFTRDKGATKILARSFGEWIDGLADSLESGSYMYDESKCDLMKSR